MDSSEPIYRRACVTCSRPALTLDHDGAAFCGAHAEVFIGAGDTTVVLDQAEIAVLLVHRPLVAGVGSFRAMSR